MGLERVELFGFGGDLGVEGGEAVVDALLLSRAAIGRVLGSTENPVTPTANLHGRVIPS